MVHIEKVVKAYWVAQRRCERCADQSKGGKDDSWLEEHDDVKYFCADGHGLRIVMYPGTRMAHRMRMSEKKNV